MAVNKLNKQPFEELDCTVDFSAALAAGSTLDSIYSVSAVNVETGTDSSAAVIATSPAPAIIGKKVQFRVKDGADGDRHKITTRIVASNGEKIEAEIYLVVKEL